MTLSLQKLSTKKGLVILLGLAIMLAAVFVFSEKASAAPSSTYPSCCSANTYVSVSNTGNGINLSAPFSYLKVKYGADTIYHDVSVYDGCYHGSGVIDSGGPASCTGGQTKFWVCPSTPSGTFDSDYKNQGRCYEADAAAWPSGAGTQLLRFYNSGTSNPQSGAMQISDVGGYHYLYVIAQMQVAGLNGFKVTATARNGGLGLATYANIGFMSTLGVDRPVSLVNLPLSAGGSTTFDLRFRIPCSYGGGTFPLRWYDADRGGAGIPIDSDIEWMLINQSSGQQFSAGQFAFIGARTGSPENLDSFLGANAETRQINVGNASFLRMQAGDLFTWRWYNVNNNNGVQVFLPFDEPDSDVNCNRPPVGNIDSASCDSVQGWAFDPDTPSQSITIHFYVNAAVGQPGAIGFNDGPTDQPRSDVNSAYGISGNHGFDWPIPSQFKDGLPHNVYVYALDSSSGFSYLGVRTFGPCTTPPEVACGNVQTVPAMPEPGEPFVVRVNFTTSGGSGPDAAYTVSLEVPGYFANTVIGTGTVARSGGSVNTDSPPITIPAPGSYDGTFTVAVTGGTPNPLTCRFGTDQPRPPIIVASRPYMRVYNGDVMTGSGFDSSGCGSSTSRFIGFNKGSAGGGAGAGTSLASFATGKNVDFVTAALRTLTNPLPLKGLAFANTGSRDNNATAGDNYGGELGSGYFGCVPDYFAIGIADGAIPKASGYNVNADVNVVPASAKYDIYVDGDAFITGNITYTTSGGFGSDPAQIPSFRLVAKGNIYIAPGVGEISGVLIAQPLADGTKGRVYTCAQSAWSGNTPAYVPDAPQQIGSCNTKLTIYGAVIAKQLKLLRVVGTLRNAVASESYTAANQAESIIFSPEIWLRNPGTGSNSGQSPYNSISGLPPIL